MAYKKKNKASNWKNENESYMANLADNPLYEKWTEGVYGRFLHKEEVSETARRPRRDSVVTCHYTGKLINGKVFDDSHKMSVPTAFRLSELISGFQIGLMEMHIGDKIEVIMSWKNGYGKLACGDDIPGYSTLIFEVELFDIY